RAAIRGSRCDKPGCRGRQSLGRFVTRDHGARLWLRPDPKPGNQIVKEQQSGRGKHPPVTTQRLKLWRADIAGRPTDGQAQTLARPYVHGTIDDGAVTVVEAIKTGFRLAGVAHAASGDSRVDRDAVVRDVPRQTDG